VVVCPQGIDIREGLQVECIACGLCIDACDSIMDKVGLPRGLVRYDTTHNASRRAQGLPDTLHLLRPRTLAYTVAVIIITTALLYSVLTRSPLELNILHDRSPLFVTLSDGSIRNGYVIKVLNKSGQDMVYSLALEGVAAEMHFQDAGDGDTPERFMVLKDKVGQFHLFLTGGRELAGQRRDINFTLKDEAGITITQPSMFVGGNHGGEE
jgi:polyferredoxin